MIKNYPYQDFTIPKTTKINIELTNLMSSNHINFKNYSLDCYFSKKSRAPSSPPQSSHTLFYDSFLYTNILDNLHKIHYFADVNGEAKDSYRDVSSLQASYQLLISALIFSVSAFSQVSFGSALKISNREESSSHNVSVHKVENFFETEFVCEINDNQSKQNKKPELIRLPIFMDSNGDGKSVLISEYSEFVCEINDNQSKQNKKLELIRDPIFMDINGDDKSVLIGEYSDGTIEICIIDGSNSWYCSRLNAMEVSFNIAEG